MSVSRRQADCAARCKFVSRCRSKRAATTATTTIERGDYFPSFSGSTFCDDGGSGLLPCGSCNSQANGTSWDCGGGCGCDFIMQIDSCCGFFTKYPLSLPVSSPLSLSLLLSPSHLVSSLSWPESCVSPVCCPRFGPRFARHSLCLLPSSLAGFFCCFKPFQAIVLQAKFGQKGGQNKKVFTLQRTWWNLWRWQSAKRKKKESTEAY